MATTDNHPRKIRFAEFRFYEELNDFLSAEQHKTSFRSPFYGNPSVKDTIQAIGVPHTAIDLILVDDQSVDFSHRLRHSEPQQQLQEVLLTLDLFRQLQPFTRCMDCNGRIQPVEKAVIKGQIDSEIFQRFQEFWQCQDCKKIYWRGSHYERMLRQVSKFGRYSHRHPEKSGHREE